MYEVARSASTDGGRALQHGDCPRSLREHRSFDGLPPQVQKTGLISGELVVGLEY
jgi:hypothetical protein